MILVSINGILVPLFLQGSDIDIVNRCRLRQRLMIDYNNEMYVQGQNDVWVVVRGTCRTFRASGGTVVSREQREVARVPGYWRLAAHVVVVVALGRRWWWHEGRRRRQARAPAPRAAGERVHGGERAHVAHARGALAAGRLRPATRSLLRPPNPRPPRPREPRALFDRRPPSACPTRPLCFVFNF